MTHTPEYHNQEDFHVRSQKLQEILSMKMDPYPHKFSFNSYSKPLHEKYHEEEVGTSEEAMNGDTPTVSVAGRMILFRAMGKNAFGHIQDSTGTIQFMCNRDQTKVLGLDPEQAGITHIKFIEKKVDLGDIIGIEGNLFRTQKGELTIYVKTFILLSKSLLALPDKHAGISDKGIRYRKRWLDLITDHDSFARFEMRSKILREIRKVFEKSEFLEVETPILQNIYGGAEARPFVTHLNALDQKMYLRIALEISLKKLIVGGFDKIFEIGKVFRNEGIDRTHNPEFTMLEAYAAYWDYNDMMEFVENVFEQVALNIFQTTKIPSVYQGNPVEVDLKAPWKRLSMKDAILQYGKVNVDEKSDDELRELLKSTDAEKGKIEKSPRGKLIALCFEELAEKHLLQPHHIIDHPIETTPLCKLHREEKLRGERFVERFESFILGNEMINAYTELNDPVMQRELLEEQHAAREAGDEEASPMDEEFIESICQGMPPTSGVGIGIDRMIMLFTQAASIRDVIFFPLMRLEDSSQTATQEEVLTEKQ